MRKTRSQLVLIINVFVGLLVQINCANAQTPLKVIDNPQGGKIIYGPVDNASTESQAMGAILRNIHNQCGDKPQVGKVFHVRGTNSDAVFFNVVKRTQGNVPVAGMIIASQAGPGKVEAAVVSDDAKRFGTTVNPMLKKLFEVWHPAGSAQTNNAKNSAGPSAPAAALHPYSLPDRSASVSLPDGWKVLPTSGGGTIVAEGPNGETVALGAAFLAMNSNDPRVRQTMQFAQSPAGRNTAYAHSLYYPYGGDLGRTFMDLIQMTRRMQGQSQISMQITNQTRVPSANERCAHLTGHVDAQDGKGMKEMNTVFCSGPLSAMGNYMNLAYHTVVPVKFADQERATMGAILSSFNQNMSVINAQASAMAAPAIAQIHEIGRLAEKQAADSHALWDSYNRGVEERWDSQDKRNQAFSNYLLDQTVIKDNELNAQGTIWNQTADSMVRNDPKRYEYVDTPNFWKGVDY